MAIQLGLTGGIGSGKSTVATMLSSMSASVIDADAFSRALTAVAGAAMPAIQNAFGTVAIAPDGSLDRDAIRSLIFTDPDAKHRLEAIIHPLVALRISQAQSDAESSGKTIVVLDIPLLVESSHWRAKLDYVLVVDCDNATQIQRVQARSGWTAQQTQRVIDAQATRTLRLAAADIVIGNQDISLSQLETTVRKIGAWFGL